MNEQQAKLAVVTAEFETLERLMRVHNEAFRLFETLARSAEMSLSLMSLDTDDKEHLRKTLQEIQTEAARHMNAEHVARLVTYEFEIENLRAELANVKTERDRLRDMCTRQDTVISDLNDLTDCKNTLRELGKVFGCDHVESPDERRQLVNCAEEQFATRDAVDADLAILVRRLVRQVLKFSPSNKTAKQATDYLQRNNLQGSILRDVEPDPVPATDEAADEPDDGEPKALCPVCGEPADLWPNSAAQSGIDRAFKWACPKGCDFGYITNAGELEEMAAKGEGSQMMRDRWQMMSDIRHVADRVKDVAGEVQRLRADLNTLYEMNGLKPAS